MSKQKGRRGNNEGSIYKRKDGRWCAETTIGYGDDGKPIRKYIYGKERKEVAKKLLPYIKNYFDFGCLPTNNPKTIFMTALNDWFLLYNRLCENSAQKSRILSVATLFSRKTEKCRE